MTQSHVLTKKIKNACQISLENISTMQSLHIYKADKKGAWKISLQNTSTIQFQGQH